MNQLPRLGKRELLFLLLFTCNYVALLRRFSLPLGAGVGLRYFIVALHISLPYNYLAAAFRRFSAIVF